MSNYEPLPKEFDGIKLRLDWFYLNPLKFQQTTDYIHEDSCAIHDLQGWDEDNCNCNIKAVEVVVGRINVFRTNGPQDDKKFFTVCIPNNLEDFTKHFEEIRNGNEKISKDKVSYLWEFKKLWPQFLKEDIENAMSTLFYHLKYYEVTGKELNFFDVDTKELDKILYDKV